MLEHVGYFKKLSLSVSNSLTGFEEKIVNRLSLGVHEGSVPRTHMDLKIMSKGNFKRMSLCSAILKTALFYPVYTG